MRIYDPRLSRFLSVDPLTMQYPELTPYQFASNTPIQAIDLDGIEYLSFHRSMYRLGYITETTTTQTGGGKSITMSSSRTVINTVYQNIPAALQDSETGSFQFVAEGPVTDIGRDYSSDELVNQAYDKTKHFVTGKFYGMANGGQDPPKTASTSGMGGGAINQTRGSGANAVGGALGEEGAGGD